MGHLQQFYASGIQVARGAADHSARRIEGPACLRVTGCPLHLQRGPRLSSQWQACSSLAGRLSTGLMPVLSQGCCAGRCLCGTDLGLQWRSHCMLPSVPRRQLTGHKVMMPLLPAHCVLMLPPLCQGSCGDMHRQGRQCRPPQRCLVPCRQQLMSQNGLLPVLPPTCTLPPWGRCAGGR